MYVLNHVIAGHHVTWTNSEHRSRAPCSRRLQADNSHGITDDDQLINKLDPDSCPVHAAKSHKSDALCHCFASKFLSVRLKEVSVPLRKSRQVCGEEQG